MKHLTLFKQITLLSIFATIIFSSCRKNNDIAPAILNQEEYFNYSVNRLQLSFAMPADSIVSDAQPESTPFVNSSSILGKRIIPASADIVKATYIRPGATAGSVQQMLVFSSPQTGYINNALPGSGTFNAPIGINITEYGNVGEYISGNFSGSVTGAAPANTPYTISGSFRVKRLY